MVKTCQTSIKQSTQKRGKENVLMEDPSPGKKTKSPTAEHKGNKSNSQHTPLLSQEAYEIRKGEEHLKRTLSQEELTYTTCPEIEVDATSLTPFACKMNSIFFLKAFRAFCASCHVGTLMNGNFQHIDANTQRPLWLEGEIGLLKNILSLNYNCNINPTR
jgi:hypothetical protein